MNLLKDTTQCLHEARTSDPSMSSTLPLRPSLTSCISRPIIEGLFTLVNLLTLSPRGEWDHTHLSYECSGYRMDHAWVTEDAIQGWGGGGGGVTLIFFFIRRLRPSIYRSSPPPPPKKKEKKNKQKTSGISSTPKQYFKF